MRITSYLTTDQLDLAIDQLVVRDRNFDWFALMLVDNVVKFIFYQHAEQDKVMWAEYSQ